MSTAAINLMLAEKQAKAQREANYSKEIEAVKEAQMWETPRRTLPPLNQAVVCITADGDAVWMKRIAADAWLESDAQDRSRGNLQPEPVAWIHAPRLPEIRT